MSIKSQFGKAGAKAEQGQRGGDTYPLDEERAQELLLQQSQAGKKKRPLIAKEKKAFDSADYFMKGEDGEGTEGGAQEGLEMIAEEQEQKINPHKSKMSSNFSSKNQVSKDDSEEDLDDQEEKEKQRQQQQKEDEERAIQIKREDEEKRVKEEQIKRAKREEEEREQNRKMKLREQQEEEKRKQQKQQQNVSSENDQEEDVMKKQQETMMLKMKGNITKKPLVAKQKKAFDSADYFMKDEHKDSDVAGTESDTIMEQVNNNKPGESKSKYGQQQAKDKKSSDSDSSKSSEKLAKVIPTSQQTGGNSEGQSPRGSALKSRSGSESRDSQNKETKRVSFSLPSEEQSATNGIKSSSKSACSSKSQSSTAPLTASTFSTNTVGNVSTEIDQPTIPTTLNNNVHSLKGSRFLTLPNTLQQESDSDVKQSEQERDLSKQQNDDIYNNKSTKGTESNSEELERLYNEQLNQAQAKLACGGKKKKPLIAKEKRKDFDSADYFLQQEKKKRESASSMFEFGNIEDDDDDDEDYLNKQNGGSSQQSKNKSKSKSNKNDYKKTASMPEFQDEDDNKQKKPSRLRESAFNKKEESTSSEEDSNPLEFQQNFDDDDEDEDDSVKNKNNNNSLSGFGGLSTAPNGVSLGSSFDEEEDFLPKITHSKISNSKFQVYKKHQSDEEEENQEQSAEERDKQKKQEEEEQKKDILEKQRQLDAIQNENNRITAAQSQKLMEEQSVGLAEANKYEQFAIPVSKHKKNLLNKEKKKEFDSADYFMKDK